MGRTPKRGESNQEPKSTFLHDKSLMASDQTDSLKIELARARTHAIKRLIELSSLAADECRETYLFKNDQFCGVRWTLGEAKAIWRSGSDEIAYEQNTQPVAAESDHQEPPLRRAA